MEREWNVECAVGDGDIGRWCRLYMCVVMFCPEIGETSDEMDGGADHFSDSDGGRVQRAFFSKYWSDGTRSYAS